MCGVCRATGGDAQASSHREAPFVTKNPKVDGTDFYMFMSYEPGRTGYVTLIANYLPLQDSYGGPNYFSMDPEALYEIEIDNVGDGHEHVTFQFRFSNALAGGTGATLPVGGKNVAAPLEVLGPISASDQSALNLNETYTIKMVKGDRRTGTASDVTMATGGGAVFTKPMDYVGNKTFGSAGGYQAYASKYMYDVAIPGCTPPANTRPRVFVGQRAESFAVNLGTIFDLVNAPASVITGAYDAGAGTDVRALVPNPLRYKNITSIELEVPASCLTQGSQTVLGGWTTASVRQARVINPDATYARPAREGGAWAQVSRLGMPLVNEVVIGIKDKDRFNSSVPSGDAQFLDYVTNPTLPAILDILFGPGLAPTVFPRADLEAVFLTGVPNVNANGATCEYQRLNTAIPATPAASQNNLGAAACFVNGALNLHHTGCDPAGFPNGRRPGDDVTDVALRVVMGYLIPGAGAPAPNGGTSPAPAGLIPFTDAVLQDQSQFDAAFPYLKTPNPGS